MGVKNIPYGKISRCDQIGKLLRLSRKEKGYVLTKVAGIAGVNVRFLSEVERGKSTAEIGKVLQVIQRLGLEMWIVPRGTEVSIKGQKPGKE